MDAMRPTDGNPTEVVPGVHNTKLVAGDTYVIPGGEPHALENRGDERVVGVDVFSPPREFAPFAEE